MKCFVIADLQNSMFPSDSGSGGVQVVWNYRYNRWELRNESKTEGRIYRNYSAAKKTAKKVGGHVSIDRQWGVHSAKVSGKPFVSSDDAETLLLHASIDRKQKDRFVKFIADKFNADTSELWAEFQKKDPAQV